MAIMYPPQLPDHVRGNPMLKGEVRSYDALAALPDEYEVFYTRGTTEDQRALAHSRPIDFIVLHEIVGLLAIDVKSGRIRMGQDGAFQHYSTSSKQWTSIDPFGELKRATAELIKQAKADGFTFFITENMCVLFPDTQRAKLTDFPERLPNGTLGADDLSLLPMHIKTLFKKPRSSRAWKHENFIDMRRRLKNTPQLKGNDKNTSVKAPVPKRAIPAASKKRVQRESASLGSPPRRRPLSTVLLPPSRSAPVKILLPRVKRSPKRPLPWLSFMLATCLGLVAFLATLLTCLWLIRLLS